MNGAEARHAAQLLVLELYGQVRVAHQALPEQVEAVTDVAERVLWQRPLVGGPCPRPRPPRAVRLVVVELDV